MVKVQRFYSYPTAHVAGLAQGLGTGGTTDVVLGHVLVPEIGLIGIVVTESTVKDLILRKL